MNKTIQSVLKLELKHPFEVYTDKCQFILSTLVKRLTRPETTGKILESVGVDVSYANKVTTRELGKTVNEIRTHARMELIRHQLLTTSTPCTDLAIMAGYANLAAMAPTFKERYGYRPHVYRLKNAFKELHEDFLMEDLRGTFTITTKLEKLLKVIRDNVHNDKSNKALGIEAGLGEFAMKGLVRRIGLTKADLIERHKVKLSIDEMEKGLHASYVAKRFGFGSANELFGLIRKYTGSKYLNLYSDAA